MDFLHIPSSYFYVLLSFYYSVFFLFSICPLHWMYSLKSQEILSILGTAVYPQNTACHIEGAQTLSEMNVLLSS